MPNPFIRLGSQIVSKPVPDRPEPIPPIPEEYVGTNNPYRGIEDHGVKPGNHPNPPGAWADNHEGFTYVEEPPAIDPIPVKLVTEYGRELRKMRVHKLSVNAARTQQFIGRNDARSSVYISNPDAALHFFVGMSQGMNTALNGFDLGPGQSVTLYTEDEIYILGTAVDPAVQTVQAIEHYSVRE